jgi:serine/threonine protein kinase
MGEVYRARDPTLGRDVAIKVLPALFTDDPERLRRFEREAQLLASLNHPNIATIHGVERVDGISALVIEGKTLAERLQSDNSSSFGRPSRDGEEGRTPHTSLPLSEALTIARQIAEAIEAAHEKGIVHRDLKPANIRIRPDGVVKVLDFGFSKAAVGEAATAAISPSPTQADGDTWAGMILGTAAYMSPEQAAQPMSRRSIASTGTGAVFHFSRLAVTPDGTRVVYVGNRGTQLFVQRFDQLDPTGDAPDSGRLRTCQTEREAGWKCAPGDAGRGAAPPE